MFFERVKETTTTTGTGTVTLAGAVAQAVAFQSVVPTGDPVDYTLIDANGTGWESGIGTLATTTTLTRDTVLSSSNSGSAITLSTGTHTVLLALSGDAMNKRDVMGDRFIDHVVSGLVVPASSGTLAGTMSAGVAYVLGARVNKAAQTRTYTASKDTYVDLSNKGVVTYAEVANNASAPAVTSNSIRLGKVVTSGGGITSAVDLRNMVYVPSCVLWGTSMSQSFTSGSSTAVNFSSAAYEKTNNAGMHSTSSNPTRITVTAAGMYKIDGYAQLGPIAGATWYSYNTLKLNGTQMAGGFTQAVVSTYPLCSIGSATRYLNVGDYLELFVSANDSASNATPLVEAGLSVTRVG